MKNIIKVCFIANLFPSVRDPSFGSFVGKNYQHLKEVNYDITETIVIDERVVGFRKLITYMVFIFKGFFKIFKGNYDFIYIHYLTYSTIPLLPYLFFGNPIYVVNIHGDDLVGEGRIHKVMGMFSNIILSKSKALVVPSLYFKDELIKRYPHVNKEKIIVSPSSGFDEKVFFPARKTFNSEQLKLGYVSRIDEGKGWQELLQALVLIRKTTPNVYAQLSLDIYGTGSQVSELNQQLADYNLRDKVAYFGALEQKELGSKYREFDAFVFPTHRESFGLVAIEAMACGIPVLASDIRPVNDIVEHNSTGLLFKRGCAKSIADAIVEFALMPTERKHELGVGAQLSVIEYGSVQVREKLKLDLHFALNKEEI
ncbi:glycosyltransferase family 4 protein [Pseudoalteromonas fenneropenaei]|uniref:Glycosyltransferase family 4 protein n=1 Tax=Pseudoalteromonas fenneropenaei TaxID=1737459 RepID=A0ABV7CKL2_9GAMM